MDKGQEEKINKLRGYFEGRDDVVMAFLFGSQAKGYARPTSDWDIGVYLTSEERVLEQSIWGDVERIVNANVDLVVLNRAAASITWAVLRSGIVLSIKNRRLYFDLMFQASDEANAWYETERAKTFLSMQDSRDK